VRNSDGTRFISDVRCSLTADYIRSRKSHNPVSFLTIYLVSYGFSRPIGLHARKKEHGIKKVRWKVDKDHILLKLVLDRIGFEDVKKIDNFNHRKVLQKKVYLLQLTGIDLGYRYNWYIYGPYCPALASDTFTLRDEIEYDDEFKDYELNSQTKGKLDRLDTIVNLPDTPETSEPEWFELLASLHYLKHIAYWPGKNNPGFEEVFEKLGQSKPHFQDKRQLATTAWKKLEEVGLTKKKTLE